jgi:hypothetical protein
VRPLWYKKITCKKQCCCPSLNLPVVPHSSKLAMRPIENTRIRASFPALPLPFGGFCAGYRDECQFLRDSPRFFKFFLSQKLSGFDITSFSSCVTNSRVSGSPIDKFNVSRARYLRLERSPLPSPHMSTTNRKGQTWSFFLGCKLLKVRMMVLLFFMRDA